MHRRTFIKKSFQLTGLIIAGIIPLESFAANKKHLCILHTNDVHSRLDPFPADAGKYAGLGGIVNRERIINQIRDTHKNVLLLDAGDMFQGTPYYNLYKGKAELEMMSLLAYDAGTIGNHDFDNGIEALAENLQYANFPLLNCNYSLTKTPLNDKVPPYKIINKGGMKIGIFGVGIELKGLVLASMYGNVVYHDPIEKANQLATYLRHSKKCDYIICLSHLGYRYQQKKVSDIWLAQQSENIDLIIGGHTHTFLKKPIELTNKKNKLVLVNQVGWGGIELGKIDVHFQRKNVLHYQTNDPVKISK